MDATMSKGWFRLVAAMVLTVPAVLLVGCGDGEFCAGDICTPDEECISGVCRPAGECEPECGEGEECLGMRCVSEEGGCDYQGQDCRVGEHGEWDGDFLCIDWNAEGMMPEAPSCARDCRTEGCPPDSECFGVGTGMGTSCESDEECDANELCMEGQCISAVCRSSDCQLGGEPEQCPDGRRCGRVFDDYDICIQEGDRQPGESCIGDSEAFEERDFQRGCVAGAGCVGGICRMHCREDDDCEREGTECVALSEGELEVCGRSCDFGAEETGCEEDETCVPTAAGGALCQDAGSTPAYEPCEPAARECEPGTICAEDDRDHPVNRCLPVCDLAAGGTDSVDQAARDATCPQPEPGDGVWQLWHMAEGGVELDVYVGDDEPAAQVGPGELAELSESGLYQLREPGRIDWAVREAGDPVTEPPLAEGEFDLDAGDHRLVALMGQPGGHRELIGSEVTIEETDRTSWVVGIPEIEGSDLWAESSAGETDRWFAGLESGQVVPRDVGADTYRIWLVPTGEGSDGEILAEFDGVTLTGDERLVGLRGTMEPTDAHPLQVPLTSEDEVPVAEAHRGLSRRCHPVNGATVGGCLEECSDEVLQIGECTGTDMGCRPRLDPRTDEWDAVCHPVGQAGESDSCDPLDERPCAEGLYCQQLDGMAGSAATGLETSGECTPLCSVGGDDCGPDRGCRPMDGAFEFGIGECRPTCQPDGSYHDPECPDDRGRCRPERRLVPAGDGIQANFDIQDQGAYCWPSGQTQPGEDCRPGECTPAAECMFDRGVQHGLVEALLSPYFGAGVAGMACQPICDPFTNEHSDHACGEGQTCLFNYPWNADVGHCAEIVEEVGVGEECDEPGRACGEDAICVSSGGTTECMRFCQFEGPDVDGYDRSTCPIGFECAPFVDDIGVCD